MHTAEHARAKPSTACASESIYSAPREQAASGGTAERRTHKPWDDRARAPAVTLVRSSVQNACRDFS
eukprot:4428766-Pleurochrysis_carterae.AAC.1